MAVLRPYCIDTGLPSAFIRQRMVGLPWLEFLWHGLRLDFEDTMSPSAGAHGLHVVVKPPRRPLCISVSLSFFCGRAWEVCTLSYFSCLTLVASSTEPASAISCSVTGGTGNFSWNSLVKAGKNSLEAVFLWFASRNAAFRCSNQASCSSVVHFRQVMSGSTGL